jgi:hypothetical protein
MLYGYSEDFAFSEAQLSLISGSFSKEVNMAANMQGNTLPFFVIEV